VVSSLAKADANKKGRTKCDSSLYYWASPHTGPLRRGAARQSPQLDLKGNSPKEKMN
jgi:hypothetical protein